MAQLTPVSEINYNTFKKLYNSNLPYNEQSEGIKQKFDQNTFNQYSAIASEEPKLGFLDKLTGGLENLFSAYGAEKPQVPNLSLGYNMPTFDLGTGITNTTAASPFKIGLSDTLTQYNVPGLRSQNLQEDLVQQIIAENQAKTNPFVRPNMLDIAGGVVPGGITEIDLMEENQLPYSGVGDMRYSTPRTIADQNRVLGQTFTEPKKSNGIFDLLMNIVMPGYNFVKNLGSGQPYERYTPGGTIRDGIYSMGGVNVPVSMMNDFYNPNTGLNRFDRAAQRFTKTGSMADLFASSRTGKEFFEKRRQIQTQKQKALEDAAKAKRQFKQDTGGGGGGGRDNTGGDIGSKGAADRFSNTSGKGRTGY